jgi:hypothetical protein
LILLLAVLLGCLCGLLFATARGQLYRLPGLRSTGLVFTGMLPQLLAFHLPWTRASIPSPWASLALLSSQALLLWFAWRNRTAPGFPILSLGVLLNLVAILANHGWMPISLQTASQLLPPASSAGLLAGTRFGFSKDLLLPPADIHLACLSDAFLAPAWLPYRFAFSLGDMLIAAGAFRFLTTFEGGRMFGKMKDEI